ncbi:MAG TPA: hypothetical protein PKX07_17340 [Aggregatilineales bacterium]|jgi:hypothetical protein|nr:hypothetical protein [Aggregatilineales bacterium]
MAQTPSSTRLEQIKHVLLLSFVGLCCLMIVLTAALALTESQQQDGPQNPNYVLSSPEQARP